MKADGWSNNNFFLNLYKIPSNLVILIIGTIILVFLGSLSSIVLFTYQNSIEILKSNQETITENKVLNEQIINYTREIPLQNKAMLQDLTRIVNFLGSNFNQSFIDGVYEERRNVNQTLEQILLNQKLLGSHINATTDILGTASHTIPPAFRNMLFRIAATNVPVTNNITIPLQSFTAQLDELLEEINKSGSVIQQLQQQVKNLSTQVPENITVTAQQPPFTAFPFAQNRIERADTPENESMLKEPEGGRIAGLP